MNVMLTYIPHGINENFYYPIRSGNRSHTLFERREDKEVQIIKTDDELTQELNNRLFGDNKPEFVVLYVNRNIRRKRPGDVILAYRTFCDSLPKEKADKCCLVMHTHAVDGNGTDLPEVAKKIGNKYRIVFSQERMNPHLMNSLYNIADVTINLASNEGFGLGTCESLMAGTPIIVTVTGGLQDQCGFVDENGDYLRHDKHFGTEWQSNHDGKYKNHGSWVIPLFPTSRALMGSPPTPYIFDDYVTFEDAAQAIKTWYNRGKEERDRCGLEGQEYVMNPTIGMKASEMSRRFIHDINHSMENWKPRSRYTLFNAVETLEDYPEGYTLTKEII